MGEYGNMRQQRLSRFEKNERPRASRVSGRNECSSFRRNTSSSKAGGVFETVSERLPQLPSSKVGRAASIAVAVIAILLLFLYGPVRDYYVSWRTGQIYAAELAEINADNGELKSEVNRLQSREGIEDEARKRGYVSEGETAVTVEGLDESDASDDEGASTSDTSAEAGNPWYITVLDALFGFDKTSIGAS